MLNHFAAWVWGPGLLVLLLATGLILTVRSKFFQLHGWKTIFRSTFGSLRHTTENRKNTGAMTQFQTFSTALAAAMGTGNILGVAAALLIGGPGAIFWMWISALLGMMLTYTENVLGQHYAREIGTQRIAGPMAYLRFGLNSPALAAIYALLCVLASFGMGNMTQSSAIAALADRAFSLPPLTVGIAVTLLLGVILLRGVKTVGKVIQWLMPMLSGVYMLAALAVIIRHGTMLPQVFSTIFREAWGLDAIGGGISGTAFRMALQTGLRHGVFSNEAGLGTSALVHAGGSSRDAELQGHWSMIEVALDTLVCCTLTALAILTSGAISASDTSEGVIIAAFSGIFQGCTEQIMAVMTGLFAFCTLIGWCCCGERAASYLLGEQALKYYRVIYCLAAGMGAVLSLHAVWALSDIANGLMAIPNLLGLLLLSRRLPNKRGSLE